MTAKPSGIEAATDTRSRILDATEQLMLDEGYAGVSSRKVTEQAGLKSKLLHHYFPKMDDLFIAAFQRRENWHVVRFAAAASSSSPLREIWALMIDSANSKLILEYNTMASHRPAVREVISRSASRDHMTIAAALGAIFERYDIDTVRYPPRVVAMTLAGLARGMSIDTALGSQDLHADTLQYVEGLISKYEPLVAPAKRRARATAKQVQALDD